jgi:hypothetical protein
MLANIREPGAIVILLFGIAFAGMLLIMGKHALLSQDEFLRLYNRWQKTERFGIKPFDLDYFGGTRRLRFIGVFLCASGLLIAVSFTWMVLGR